MSAALLFAQPFAYVPDNRPTTATPGAPLAGAQIYIFQAGSSTPAVVYTDVGLTVPWIQPIVTTSAGESSGPIYVSPTPSLKVRIDDANNVTLPGWPVDNITPYALTA